jgi:tRNA(Ile)-lysidine synthase TilS/MesJ
VSKHKRACRTGKSPFHDQAAAKAAITRIRQSGEQRDKTPTRAYLCEFCHRWHLTSKEDHSESQDNNRQVRRRRRMRTYIDDDGWLDATG